MLRRSILLTIAVAAALALPAIAMSATYSWRDAKAGRITRDVCPPGAACRALRPPGCRWTRPRARRGLSYTAHRRAREARPRPIASTSSDPGHWSRRGVARAAASGRPASPAPVSPPSAETTPPSAPAPAPTPTPDPDCRHLAQARRPIRRPRPDPVQTPGPHRDAGPGAYARSDAHAGSGADARADCNAHADPAPEPSPRRARRTPLNRVRSLARATGWSRIGTFRWTTFATHCARGRVSSGLQRRLSEIQ